MKIRKATYTRAGKSQEAKRLYGDFTDHSGIRRRMPLFEDQKNSREAARAIERLVSIRASGDVIPPELRRFLENARPQMRNSLLEWKIVDAAVVGSTQLLDELVDEWGAAIARKDRGPEYIALKTGRVRSVFRDANMLRWQDITEEGVEKRLQAYRDAEVGSKSASTSNHYLQAVQQFCKWMVKKKKRALVSPVVGIEPVDTGGKLRRDRRAFELEEFHELMQYLETAPATFKISAAHRTLIYAFSVETGLRFAFTTKLTVKRIVMHKDRPHVFVPQSNRIKYSRDRLIPLNDELWSLLKPLIIGRAPTDLVFTLPTRGHGAKMVKRDLDGARKRWIAAAKGEEEQRQRENSDFLRYQDSDGRHVDFHALRHTRAVWLFKHHGAEGRDVQDLMGLGSLELVDRYARSFKSEHAELVSRGPKLLPGTLPNCPSKKTTLGGTESEVEKLARQLAKTDGIQQPSANLGGQNGLRILANADGQITSETLGKSGVLTPEERGVILKLPLGEVAERLNAPVSKTG